MGHIGHLRVKMRQGGNAGAQHIHVKRIFGHFADQIHQCIRNVTLAADLLAERLVLGLVGQIVMQQQVSHLFVGRVFGQIPNVITPVDQAVKLRIDAGNLADAGNNAFKARTVCLCCFHGDTSTFYEC